MSQRRLPATGSAVRVDMVDECIQILTIDRPERRNALDQAAYRGLAAGLRAADANADVRVSVVAGSGGVFCSGNDLADFRRPSSESLPAGSELLDALVGGREPTIAAIEGFAIGVGVTMVLHCDLAYAGAGSRFRMPFTALGLCPEAGSTYLLPRVAGDKKAAELLLLGEEFDAGTAAGVGIINEAVEDGAALSFALDRAAAIARLPVGAIESTRSLLRARDRDAV